MKVFTIILIIAFGLSFPLFSRGKEDQAIMEASVEMESSMEMESLLEFTSLENAMTLAEDFPVVLFFHASWCPSCKAAMNDLRKNTADLGPIKVLIVDYDNSEDLQMKYSVTYQHSFVQIDSQGKALAKWNGGDTRTILENMKEKEM